MGKKALICVNKDFLETSRYPRQKKKFEATLAGLNRDDVQATVQPIVFTGKDGHEVVDNIADQLRSQMGKFFDDTIISLFGDSGVCPFLNAMRQNVNDHPISTDSTLRPNPIYIGPCGTMETLAKTMNMNTAERVIGVMSGDLPHIVQDIKVRNVNIDTYDGEDLVRSQKNDWLLYCGTGMDGESMEKQESKPRSRPAFVNLTHTTTQLMASAMDKSKPGITVDSVMTLPFYGFFKFNRERYDALDKDYFYNIQFHSKRGMEAIARIAIYSMIGSNERLNEYLWEHCEGFSDIVDSAKPKKIESHKIIVRPEDPYLHIDSYPEGLNLDEGQHCELTFSTTDEVVQVVKAVV